MTLVSYSLPGIQTQKEDVATTSIPATTKAETLPPRTSGGCPTTGRVGGRPGPSTTTGPSTLRSLLPCSIRAPLRLRSRPKTPALQWSAPQRPQPPRPTPGGTAGKHEASTRRLIDPGSEATRSLKDESDSAKHKLTLEGNQLSLLFFIFLFLFINQRNCVVGYSPPLMGGSE